MKFSYLIVTRNRVEELSKTLQNLKKEFNSEEEEVLVYSDGCKETVELQKKYDWVTWYANDKSIGASPARAFLYAQAHGSYLIGLDDDAHIITTGFKEKIIQIFQNPSIGIIAFKEVRGIFETNEKAIQKIESEIIFYETNDFVGCGFAIKKDVYNKTRGFPTWIDIYGEEPCVSLEVMQAGYEIWFTNEVAVNHRVDVEKRKWQGKNYFRFQKQLQNSFFIFYNYYPRPWFSIAKLFWHNFKKYAISDIKYFKNYFKAVFFVIFNFYEKSKFRNPVDKKIIKNKRYKIGITY